jgi:hypothetical protein
MLNVIMLSVVYPECRLFIVMKSIVMLNAVMLNFVMPNVIYAECCIFIVMLSVVMLNVTFMQCRVFDCYAECCYAQHSAECHLCWMLLYQYHYADCHNTEGHNALINYNSQGILKGEVSLYNWPPVWLVWISLFCK